MPESQSFHLQEECYSVPLTVHLPNFSVEVVEGFMESLDQGQRTSPNNRAEKEVQRSITELLGNEDSDFEILSQAEENLESALHFSEVDVSEEKKDEEFSRCPVDWG